MLSNFVSFPSIASSTTFSARYSLLKSLRKRGSSCQRFFSAQSDNSSGVLGYLADLEQRNLIRSSYPSNLLLEFRKSISNLPRVAYAGFDPTADSLHVGNLLVVLNLLRTGLFGMQPIALVGGATAAVGDPSGRTTERDLSVKEKVTANTISIAEQIQRISKNALEGKGVELVLLNNNEWFSKMNCVDFLRAGKELRIGKMLRMGAIRDRLGSEGETEAEGISYTEFSYQVMQAYDWAYLAKNKDCYFQIGGSDQLGHLDLGAHYIKKTCDGKLAAGVCLPLVTDAAGNKLGKSVGGGGIWLNADRTSPFHFYQFFRQLHDTEAESLLIQFSLRPFEELSCLLKEHRSNLGKWMAQDALAIEMTRLVHGQEGVEKAQRCSRALFQGSMDDIHSLSRTELVSLFGGCSEVNKSSVLTMGDVADRTRSDNIKGSTLMTKGAFKINGQKVTSPSDAVSWSSIILPATEDLTLVCWGKRKFQLVRWV